MPKFTPGVLVSALLLAASAGVVELAAAGLTYAAPAGWKSVPTSSSMRVAEFRLPKTAPDAEDAELVAYYFGGDGGSVDANIERWLGQVAQPGGRPSSAVAKRETRTINGLTVTLLDVSGTYLGGMGPGGPAPAQKPHFRLRTAVVQTGKGPYFIKLTGPEKTMATWAPAFDRFMASMKFVQ
jgi:hypothetical protein